VTLYLHTFKPNVDWSTNNWAVVLDSPDVDGARAAFESAPATAKWRDEDPVTHAMYEIKAGMVLVADGYDSAELQVKP
jgi:hypothetical protein